MEANKWFIIKQVSTVCKESSIAVGNTKNHDSEPNRGAGELGYLFTVLHWLRVLSGESLSVISGFPVHGHSVFPRPEKAFKWGSPGVSCK